MITATSYCMPSKFFLLPIFRNPLFKIGNRAIPLNIIGGNATKVRQVADFFKEGQVEMYNCEEFKLTHGVTVTEVRYDRITTAIMEGLQKLNFNLAEAEIHQQPRQSIATHIANKDKKGCRFFYNILRRKENDKLDTSKPETKWHDELDTNLSVDFWNSSWKLLAGLKMNNDLKWLEYQVLRSILKTNTIVSKFIPLVNEQCCFCGASRETISHLLYYCNHSANIWNILNQFLSENNVPTISMTRTNILFGNPKEKSNSLENTLILLVKKYIWCSKFKDSIPTLIGFKNVLKYYLNSLSVTYEILGNSVQFDEIWGRLYYIL